MSRRHVDLEEERTSGRVAGMSSARSRATHLAGSQYMTWLSLSAVRTRMDGYGRGARLVYGQ